MRKVSENQPPRFKFNTYEYTANDFMNTILGIKELAGRKRETILREY